MNGLLFFIVAHFFTLRLLRRWQAQKNLAPRVWALEQAMRRCDYGRRSVPAPTNSLQLFLDRCVGQKLDQGRLELDQLSDLGALLTEALRKQALSERFAALILVHGCLCLSLALSVHLGLVGTLWFSVRTPATALAVVVYGLALGGFLHAVPWPRSLHDEAWLKNFLGTWFQVRTGNSGGDDAELGELLRFERESGHSQEQMRQQILLRRWRQELDRVDGRLRLVEDWLGVWELGLASLLALLLWLPLLLEKLHSALPS